MKKIVTIGGGTGTFTVLSGLKKTNNDLTAIVTVADSGGSTGRLRDEFGYLPVGDLRMAIVALADDNGDHSLLRELFLYRFDKGLGLRGHNFGNLILTALSDILNSEEQAFEYVSKILRVSGKVLPVTYGDVNLVAHYEDGSVIVGESFIDEPHESHDGTQRITNVNIQPKSQISAKAKKAILEADLIVLGPGDLYTSTVATLVVDGVTEAIEKSNAKIVYFINLINKYGHTYDFKASHHIEEIRKYLGFYPNIVVLNSSKLSPRILKKYEQERGFPVEDNLKDNSDFKVIRTDLLTDRIIKRKSGDTVRRSLIRHDSDKLAKLLVDLL